MASASSSSARLLFSDSKRRLSQRINVNTQNATSVARQVVRGSKSKEVTSYPRTPIPCALKLCGASAYRSRADDDGCGQESGAGRMVGGQHDAGADQNGADPHAHRFPVSGHCGRLPEDCDCRRTGAGVEALDRAIDCNSIIIINFYPKLNKDVLVREDYSKMCLVTIYDD